MYILLLADILSKKYMINLRSGKKLIHKDTKRPEVNRSVMALLKMDIL